MLTAKEKKDSVTEWMLKDDPVKEWLQKDDSVKELLPQNEPELVELHFELEIDYEHAFQEPDGQVITRCIAEVMNLPHNEVFFDGVDEIQKADEFYGLFRGHIPTTKHRMEGLVSIFYNSLQTRELQNKMATHSGIIGAPDLEIRELYETDQNENDDPVEDEQYEEALTVVILKEGLIHRKREKDRDFDVKFLFPFNVLFDLFYSVFLWNMSGFPAIYCVDRGGDGKESKCDWLDFKVTHC